MAHFAKIINGIVTEVIVAEQEFIDEWKQGETWVQTSYNTVRGVHVNPETRQPDGGTALRGNFAGVGMLYDSVRDVFYHPQPYPSWTLNETTWVWQAPIADPSSGDNIYEWKEDAYQADNTTGWFLVE
jgi:hypothetical protein